MRCAEIVLVPVWFQRRFLVHLVKVRYTFFFLFLKSAELSKKKKNTKISPKGTLGQRFLFRDERQSQSCPNNKKQIPEVGFLDGDSNLIYYSLKGLFISCEFSYGHWYTSKCWEILIKVWMWSAFTLFIALFYFCLKCNNNVLSSQTTENIQYLIKCH